MKEFKTLTKRETAELGRKLGGILKPGDIVCLNGDLGAGKTAFTKGIAEALGVEGYITSPTFTIVNEYHGFKPLYHFDVYRIADPEEMYEIGFEEYLNGDGIVVIEWSDLISEIIPPRHVRVEIRKTPEDLNARLIRVEFIGEDFEGYESKLEI